MSTLDLRPPEVVMRLARLGAAQPSRLSFLRVLMRRAARERWRVRRARFELNDCGFGRAVYAVETPRRVYSLVAFSTPLEDEHRTDRVIAQAWDSSYVLYDGLPDTDEVVRLKATAPLQEAGRFTQRDLVLARANKSVRLFQIVVDALARGEQPDEEQLANVGYLMRTTAVYGNGKFGIADRDEIASRPELAGPFQAEMLTVWLIRSFTFDLADHIASRRNPGGAARLAHRLRRILGVGNATGLGMAPFLVRHPVLIHNWFFARETALARVRALPRAAERERNAFARALDDMRGRVARWRSADPRQSAAIAALRADLEALTREAPAIFNRQARPWDAVYRLAEERLSLEGQEACVSLLLEPHGAAIDDLAETMNADESVGYSIGGRMTCAALSALIENRYAWARRIDFCDPAANARFWYVSAEKLEPRLGQRFEEDGSELRAASRHRPRRARSIGGAASRARRNECGELSSSPARVAACRAPRSDRGQISLRRNLRQSDRRGFAAGRSPARQARFFRCAQFRPALGSLAAHRALRRRASDRGDWRGRGARRGRVIDLSLNEAETLAAKAARGAGFSWGLADEIGRAARVLAMQGEDWGEALLALVGAAQAFEAPSAERIALWRRGEQDLPGAQPLCPVRTAAFLLDVAAEFSTGAAADRQCRPADLAFRDPRAFRTMDCRVGGAAGGKRRDDPPHRSCRAPARRKPRRPGAENAGGA